MNDPRDFLPAKYKKNQTDSVSNNSVNSFSEDKAEERIDSPWSDLAKEPEIPEYRSASSFEEKLKEDTKDLGATLDSGLGSLKTDKVEVSKSAFVPKKKPNNKLVGLLVVFFLVIGVFSSYLLTKQNQDNRQQASGGTPYDVEDNRFGWCGGCNPPRPATEADWANMNVQVSGTYVWTTQNADGTTTTQRYIIDLPATHEAAIDYATQWNGINDYVGDPDGVGDVELAPFYMCGSGDAYNVVNCSTDASLCSVIENGRCYLTPEAYQAEQDLGHTWVPDGVGCGDGVHDTIDCQEWHFTTCLNQGSGVNGYGCDSTQDNGTITEDNPTDEPTSPPTAPPTTVTTTITTTPALLACGSLGCVQNADCGTGLVCQSVTISGQAKKICAKAENNLFCAANPTTASCCDTQTTPRCASIEMLDETNNIMEASDDANLKDGDQVRFRCSAVGNQDIAFDYEFRIWARNTNFWTNLTDTTGTLAKNISDSYIIRNTGDYVAQGRICVGTECQSWEVVTGSPATMSANTN